MTLKTSGSLSMTEIAAEADIPISIPARLGQRAVRNLARIFYSYTRIAYSDLYGKTRFTFNNGKFDKGALTPGPGTYVMPGWTVFRSQIKLNGLSTVEGYPTPSDPTIPPRSPGDNVNAFPQPGYSAYQYDAYLTNDLPPGFSAPTRSLRLVGLGITASYGVVHGPWAISNEPIGVEEGDEVSFWWKAAGSTDAYDIFAYLLNVKNGTIINLANSTGANTSGTAPWQRVSRIITSAQASADYTDGDYKFVFISGSYDFTGGQWTGASLYVTNIEIKKWFEFLDEEYLEGPFNEGAGALFTVYGNYDTGKYVLATPSWPGILYRAGDKITIPGTKLGGISPDHDALITVTSVDAERGATAATIQGSIGPDALFPYYRVGESYIGKNINEVKYGTDFLQKVDMLFPASAPRGVIMFVHGGGWTSGAKSKGGFRDTASAYYNNENADMELLKNAGYLVINCNYRLAHDTSNGFGGSDNGYGLNPIDDISRVVNLLTDSGVTDVSGWWNIARGYVLQKGLMISGKSVGGQLAVMGAGEHLIKNSIKAVVSIAGPMDLQHGEDLQIPVYMQSLIDHYTQNNESLRQYCSPIYRYQRYAAEFQKPLSFYGPLKDSVAKFYFVQNIKDSLVTNNMVAPFISFITSEIGPLRTKLISINEDDPTTPSSTANHEIVTSNSTLLIQIASEIFTNPTESEVTEYLKQ